MNTNFKVSGLTQLGMKPMSTAPEADALTTRPSEPFKRLKKKQKKQSYCKVFLVSGSFGSVDTVVIISVQARRNEIVTCFASCALLMITVVEVTIITMALFFPIKIIVIVNGVELIIIK